MVQGLKSIERPETCHLWKLKFLKNFIIYDFLFSEPKCQYRHIVFLWTQISKLVMGPQMDIHYTWAEQIDADSHQLDPFIENIKK